VFQAGIKPSTRTPKKSAGEPSFPHRRTGTAIHIAERGEVLGGQIGRWSVPLTTGIAERGEVLGGQIGRWSVPLTTGSPKLVLCPELSASSFWSKLNPTKAKTTESKPAAAMMPAPTPTVAGDWWQDPSPLSRLR
jgi:hypothetical protein